MRSIDMELHLDSMIIIVGRPLGAKEVLGSAKPFLAQKVLQFLRNGAENECGSSNVVWLLVVPSTESKLSLFTSCPRLKGFGCMMLIMLTKRSTFQFVPYLEHPVYQEPLICGYV